VAKTEGGAEDLTVLVMWSIRDEREKGEEWTMRTEVSITNIGRFPLGFPEHKMSNVTFWFNGL
jgi:hypothetical protein